MSRSTAISEIWLSLHLASVDLAQAIEESEGAEAGLELHVASHAVHRALVALDPGERPAYWRPPRVVALTLDEAIVMMGVIELLHDSPAPPPWLARLAQSSRERLRTRVDAVGGFGCEGWAQVLAD